MGYGFFFLVLGLVVGCGDSDSGEETPFGDVDQVRVYRQALEPIIVEVSAVEAQVEAEAVGTSGAATAENLAAAYQRVLGRLTRALVDFDKLEPPPKLAILHRDVEQLLLLRLEAYTTLLEGWSNNEEGLYEVAEARLAAANALIVGLNEQLMQVDAALAEVGGNPVALGRQLPGLPTLSFTRFIFCTIQAVG